MVLILLGSGPGSALPQMQLQPVKTLDKSISLRGVHAINRDQAWVCGSAGSVYCINLDRHRFQKILIPGTGSLDFRDLAILHETAMLVMSAGPGGNSRIYRSGDSGRNWNLVYRLPHKDGFLNSLAFWNASSGLAVGDPVKGRIFIVATLDGGKTWGEIEGIRMPPARPGEAGFAASGTCVAVCGEQLAWIGTGGKVARVFKTRNRGKNWNVFQTPVLSGENSRGIFSIYFSNARTGVIVGGDYKNEEARIRTAAYTTDGGSKWIAVKNGMLPFLSCIGEILYHKESAYIATGPKGTFFSRKGIHWKKISAQCYHSLSISRDRKSAWLAGSNGRVARIILQ